MRKETIIKYEKEFLAWCKGESILLGAPASMHDKTLIWREVRDFNDWKPLDTVYVLNDSYSDYRKALAEGKSIEFYELVDEDEFDSTKDVYKWLEWRSATPSSAFTKTLNYRIKPEEPKFKVGDWVRDKKRKHKPFMVTSSDLETDSPNYVKIDCELWQPQPGEWCWYSKWDKIVCVEFYLCKYTLDMNEVEPEYKHKYEPFIGQLPTYLRK